jgi:hypothetical protein
LARVIRASDIQLGDSAASDIEAIEMDGQLGGRAYID